MWHVALAKDNPMKLRLATDDKGNIMIPIGTNGGGDRCLVRWKAANATEWTTEKVEGGYFKKMPSVGVYDFELGPQYIVGINYSRFDENDAAPKQLLDIVAWGDVEWQRLSGAFEGCKNLNISATDVPNLKMVKSLSQMFSGCVELNSPNLSDWDVSRVAEFYSMFEGCTKFNQSLAKWDVSKGESMFDMFKGANAFDQSLATWNLSSCKYFELPPVMSEANYATTLKGWANNTQIREKLTLSVPLLSYAAAKEARAKLISTKGWRFMGDYEKLGTPKGNKPFIFKIRALDPKVSLLLQGKNFSYTYQRDGDSEVAVNNVTSSVSKLSSFDAAKGATYTITVKPQGVVALGTGFYQSKETTYEITEIVSFGDVQWATAITFLPGFGGKIEATAGTPDFSIVQDVTYMLAGLKEEAQIDVSQWDVSKIETFFHPFYNIEKKDLDISGWKLHACKSLVLDGSGLSPEMYEKALKAWSEDTNTKEGVTLLAGGLIYNPSAAPYRKKLIDEKHWKIEGDNLPWYISLRDDNTTPLFVGGENRYRIERKGVTNEEVNKLVFTSEPAGALTFSRDPKNQDYLLVKGVLAGDAIIKAHLDAVPNGRGEVNLAYPVTVLAKPTAIKVMDAEGNEITGNEYTVKEGTTVRLTAESVPAGINSFDFQVTPPPRSFHQYGNECSFRPTRNEHIVTVTLKGSDEPKKEFKLVVKPVLKVKLNYVAPLLKLFLNGEDSEKSYQLTATVTPEASASSQNVTYSVEGEEGVVTVSPTGLITAQKPGKVLVKVTPEDKNATPAELEVVVDYKLEAFTVTQNGKPIVGNKFTMNLNEPVLLKANFTPEEIANKNVWWGAPQEYFESLPKTPEVTLKARKTGTDIPLDVRPQADPNKVLQLLITIENKATGLLISDGLSDYTNQTFLMKKGDEKQFFANPFPHAAEPRTDLVWTSENSTKVEVVNGKVSVKDEAAVGDLVKITLKTTNEPILEASFTVKVVAKVEPVKSITFEQTSFDKFVGEEFDLGMKILPETAQQTVAWLIAPLTSDPIVDITPSGKVRALKPGTVTVTARAENNVTSAPVTITLSNKVASIAFLNPAKEVTTDTPTLFSLSFIPSEGINDEVEVSFEPTGFLALKPQSESRKIAVQGIKDSKGQKVKITVKSKKQPDLAPAECEVVVKGNSVPLKGLRIFNGAVDCTEQELRVDKNFNATLTCKPTPDAAELPAGLKWSSDKPMKVSVEETTGKVKVEAAAAVNDVVTITVETPTAPKLKASLTLKVVAEVKEPESVTLEPTESQKLWVGKELQLHVSVLPAEASQLVSWVFDPADQQVVEISSKNVLTAKSAGSVKVKARTANGKESAQLAISVVEKLTMLAFENPVKTVVVGGADVSFTLKFTPEEGVDKTLDVSFAPEGYLEKVSFENGVLTVKGKKELAEGKVTISVKSPFYTELAPVTHEVAVKKPRPVEGISIKDENNNWVMSVNEQRAPVVEFTPKDATNQELTWTSNNAEVAYYDDAKAQVVAKSVGEAELTATSVDGGFKAVLKVSVKDKIEVISITLPATESVEVGKTKTLTVTFNPTNATDKTLTWTSSNPAVAKVAAGVVTGVAAGTATITATSANGKNAPCTVTVTTPTPVEEAFFADVVVAPNPCSEQLRILNPQGHVGAYELLNLSGQLLLSGVLEGTEVVIEMGTLPAGNYLLRLSAQGVQGKVVNVVKR